MVKNKFYKNLFQSLSFFSVIMTFVFFFLIGFFASLKYDGYGWILLVLSVTLVTLYFILGFYWIFQKIEIDYVGIKQTFFKKTIKEVIWENIDEIACTTVMKNPAYVITFNNTERLVLDKRKKIRDAIKHFSNEKVNNMF